MVREDINLYHCDPWAKTKKTDVKCYGQNKTIYTYRCLCGSPSPEGKAHVQNGIFGSYMDAIFKLVVREESEI